MNKAQIDFIIPSYSSPMLTICCIRSFEKNKGDFDFRYIIVENACDDSYKEDVLSVSENVLWINNPSKNTIAANRHAWGNAEAIEIGLQNSTSEYVFICHNDVAATHPDWMKTLYSKVEEGCKMVGTRFDNPESQRIGALHQSGLLINREVALNVPSIYPEWDEESSSWKLDVGDAFTRYCRQNNLEYFCFRNTHNRNVDIELPTPYNEMTFDRVIDSDGNVIYMHLGRGSMKQSNRYYGKNNIEQWKNFLEGEIL